MKKYLLTFTILLSLLSVINVSQANADCSAENPCGTWAVLDNQGVVTNVIVCQTSVCGGGNFGGQTVVPQVAPNPVTHDPYGMGSYIGDPEQGTEVKYSDGIFTITENIVVTNTSTEINGSTTIVSEVQVPVATRSFRYEDTINKMYGEVVMNNIFFDQNSSANLSVKNINSTDIITESVSFTERKTSQEIEEIFVNNSLDLLFSKVQTLISLLGSWVK